MNENFVLNLNEVDESKVGTFAVMPTGDYEAIVDDVEFGYSNNSGAPMLTWKFKIVGGEFDNRTLFFHTVLNKEFGIAQAKRAIINSGADVDFGNFNPQAFAEEGWAINLPITITVGIQTYQGEKRNNVKGTKPCTSGDGFIQQ